LVQMFVNYEAAEYDRACKNKGNQRWTLTANAGFIGELELHW